MDPFFFDNPIKGAAYRDMLINHVEPQQDGAPPHIEKSVKEYLEEISNRFPGNKVISRHFNSSWPPRSPDLNPMDFFFWGYHKNKVYQDEIFYNTDDLRQKILSCIAEIGCDLLRKLVDNVPKRLETVIENSGSHIEKFDSFS